MTGAGRVSMKGRNDSKDTSSRAPSLRTNSASRGILVPHGLICVAEEIAVVLQQFLQTGAGHVYQFDLHLFGGPGGLTALQNILFPRARRLHHLIHGAVAVVVEALAEPDRAVKHDAGLAE